VKDRDWILTTKQSAEGMLEDAPENRSGAKIPFHIGPNREQILREVMDAGFIRARGHGAELTLEFTCGIQEALNACRGFLAMIGGPFLLCRFNCLREFRSLEIYYSEYQQGLGR
jgi:hypothetical protein